MCVKALQFVRVYVSQVAGGAAPGILRSRPTKDAKGLKARKKRETEGAKLADTKANVQCGADDTEANVKGGKTHADETCGEETKAERVEGNRTRTREISVDADTTNRCEAVMPSKERFTCLERRRSSGGKDRACGGGGTETKAGAPRTSKALGIKREGPADPQKPRQAHPFFQRRGQCKAPVPSEASTGRARNHGDCRDISGDFCNPQERPNEVSGISGPSRSCSRSFTPSDGAFSSCSATQAPSWSSAWAADVYIFSPLASLGLLRQGLGGDMLDNFRHFWSALDLQAIAFVALQLGCPVDALIFAEQELERRCPDSGLEEGLAVVSQQWQRVQWDRMPQIRSVQVLRQMLLDAQRGQGRSPEVPRPPRADEKAAPDPEAGRGKGRAAEAGTDEQVTWEKTGVVAEGAGRAPDCGQVPGEKGQGEEGTVGSHGNRPSTEHGISPESVRHFQLSLQLLREMSIRPANASALLTPVGPAPLFLLVSQALINANEEDLSAVTDCLSAWHTSNFLIQRMHAENDWLATLTLQQEQLETLESKRLQVLAQLRQLDITGLHGHPGQAAWSTSSLGLDAKSVIENEAAGRSQITRQGDRDLHTRLREVEEELYATKLQMADALGAIGLHSLRESLLVSLSLSSSAPSPLSHAPSYPSLVSTVSSPRSPVGFEGSWSGPGGWASGVVGTRPFSASIGVGFPPLLEDEGTAADCGATAWLEKKFECLWRLHRWDCDETPWEASQTETWSTSDSNDDLIDSFSPCPRRSRDQTKQSLSLFNGCIYAALSLIHGAASCRPSSWVCPSHSSHTCNKGARAFPPSPLERASHSATRQQQTSLFSTPENVILDAGADVGNGDQVDGEAEEARIFQRGLSSTMARLRAVQTSRHALTLALERLARSPQLAGSSLSSFGRSSVEASDQSLSRRLLGAYVELSMAHALQRATTLNLLLNQCEQNWNDDPCGEASFEHLQSSWANDLAVTAGAASACSSSASSPSLSSLPFFLEPLVSLQTCILQAAIPLFHCIRPSASSLPGFVGHWTLRKENATTACIRERQEDTSRFQRCCGDRVEDLTDGHACGCHVRRPAARHLLLLAQMKRERGDWRGSLENLLQAKEHLLQLQRDRERPFWDAIPAQLAVWRDAYLSGVSCCHASDTDSLFHVSSLASASLPRHSCLPASRSSLAAIPPVCSGLNGGRRLPPAFSPSFLCVDLFLVQWQLAKTLYLAGDRSGSLNIASRLCQPKNWPVLPFQKAHASGPSGPSASSGIQRSGAVSGDAARSPGALYQPIKRLLPSGCGRENIALETPTNLLNGDMEELAIGKFRQAMIDALCSCGEWQFRGRWATEATVRRRYFSLALRLGPVSNSLEPSQRLATLIDDQLQSYSDYKHSLPSLVMADLRRKEKAEIEGLLQQLSAACEERGEEEQSRPAHAYKKFLQHHIDILMQKQHGLEREREREYQERTQWALEAVALYATCLRDPFLPHATKTTSRVLRLWFEWGDNVPEMNAVLHRLLIAPFAASQPQARQQVGSAVSSKSSSAPTQKMHDEDDSSVGGPPDLRHLLPFVYQIASRLGSPAESPFQRTLRELLVTTARQYPFQCLYQLVAIRNGRRIPPGHKGSDSFTVKQDKIDAAQDVLARIADSSPSLKFVVTAVESLVDFYNDLCLLDFDEEIRDVQKRQRNLPLLQRGSSQSVPLIFTPQEQMLRLPSFHKLEEYSALLPVPTVELHRDRLVPFQPPETLTRIKNAPDFLLHLSSYIHSFHPCCLSGFPGDRLRMRVKVIGSGITKPKLLCIWDRKGRKHKQCCKGREDVRQDRVAQQLFSMLNQVFLEAPSTLEKNFYLRTYVVVPFSPAVGILEWVNDAVTLAQYLIGNPDNGYHGAHARYRPQDWTFTACRQKLRLAREKALAQRRQMLSLGTTDDGGLQKGQQTKAVSGADSGSYSLVESLVQTYDEICDHFKPVLHHFFLEHFPSADVWYEKRQRYRRTLAVSSMVSYIIGLGDRHTNNILLDVASGDLIHIDFGVVFEQGKLLAIPELVPFRLTRDLVDGLGCLGVAGCFKRDCETTMEVLRRVSPLVVSIVEVLLFDPLYRWCLDPRRILQESDKSLALSPSSRPGNGAKKGEPKRARDGGGRGRGKRTSVSTLPFAEQKGRKRGRHEAIPEKIPSSSALHESDAAGAAEETRDHEDSVDDVKRKHVDSEMPIVEDILTKAEGNMNAKLAVLTVRRKLEGYEEGEIAQLSVNAHVARLVNAAQDRTALAQMFVGWAPWV
ncbi:UNVERIFIED_CONTAM: FATC domain-containing protein [Hammondia hammondi]|eukprot:XP_008883868.1 FATC domain-containing protein [Hammondia hammondi]